MSSGLIRAGEEGIVGGNGSTITINDGMVFGGQNGIRLLSGFPSVPVLVNVAGGTVEGTAGTGIVTEEIATGRALTLGVGPAATIRGNTAIASTGAPVAATVAGTVIGTGGTAIQFGAANDVLTLRPTASITGNVVADLGTDTFRLGGDFDPGTFDVVPDRPRRQVPGIRAVREDGLVDLEAHRQWQSELDDRRRHAGRRHAQSARQHPQQ